MPSQDNYFRIADNPLRGFAEDVEDGALSNDGVKWAGERLTEIAGVWLPVIMSVPDSLPWMESVDAKMVRARNTSTPSMLKLVCSSNTKRDLILKSNGQEAWIVHYIEDSVPPIRLGVLLGECVFNIRSALDNLVCGLIQPGFTRPSKVPNSPFVPPKSSGKGIARIPEGC